MRREAIRPDRSSEAATHGNVAISVDDVSKRFRLYQQRATSLKEALTYHRGSEPKHKDFWAVRGASFEIEAGTTYGLIGHNGSGKSTLLRMMAGIHRPTSGKVTTHGRISALLELGAGFHPELSGRENVFLNGSILGLNRREVNAVIDDIIEFAGMEEFIDSPVKIYSSGMYVRLGFSVAVHVNPDILLIDEVIAVGDEEFQRRCFEHIYRLRREGVTIVMVSHSSAIIESMCDKVTWLDHGHVMAIGDASDVMRQYMSRVNEEEANRIAEEQAQEPQEPLATLSASVASGEVHNDGHRRGSGEVRVDRLEFLGADGSPRSVGATGESFTIRIHVTATTPIQDPVIALEFRHESGAHIAGPNTKFGHMELGTLHGSTYVDYVLNPLPLMPGDWRVGASLSDDQMLHIYDLVAEGFPLRVQPGTSPERNGLVDLRGEWCLPNE